MNQPAGFTHTLPNGLRVICQNSASGIAYCGIAVDTGTRDEFPHEHGMAHLVEHLLFKGTKRRKAHHIAGRLENVGGELNAYTSKEMTMIYAAFLPEYSERALELLSDVIFNSVFPDNQIEKERDVIMDEINSYLDSPSELIYDDFENLVFRGHEIGRYILGTPDSLLNFDRQKIETFFSRQYHPRNMVLFFFGQTPPQRVFRLCEKYFNVNAAVEPAQPIKKRTAPGKIFPETQRIDKETSQAHVMLGWRTLDMFHADRYPLYLLNHVLGGGAANSRLNNSLREKHALVYHVESNLTTYTDTGVFSVYFGCDKKSVAKCLKLIHAELKKLADMPLTAAQLSAAKRQYKGQLGIASDNNESQALRMGKSFLYYNRYASLEDVFGKIDAVSASDMQELAQKLFASGQPFRLEYL